MYGIPDVYAAWTVGSVIVILLLLSSSGAVPQKPTQMLSALLLYVAVFWFFGQTYFIPAGLAAVGIFAVYVTSMILSKSTSRKKKRSSSSNNMGKRPNPYESLDLPENSLPTDNSRKSRRCRSRSRSRRQTPRKA